MRYLIITLILLLLSASSALAEEWFEAMEASALEVSVRPNILREIPSDKTGFHRASKNIKRNLLSNITRNSIVRSPEANPRAGAGLVNPPGPTVGPGSVNTGGGFDRTNRGPGGPTGAPGQPPPPNLEW
jgi:hypothetical protein